MRKEVGIAVRSKETISQLKSVRNSYVAIMHQPVTVSSNMQPNACTNKAFSSTSTRFNPYFGWCYCFYTAERCYSAFTHLCTSAVVLKQVQMVIITSINDFFPYCSNVVQLNKYSQKLASYSYS